MSPPLDVGGYLVELGDFSISMDSIRIQGKVLKTNDKKVVHFTTTSIVKTLKHCQICKITVVDSDGNFHNEQFQAFSFDWSPIGNLCGSFQKALKEGEAYDEEQDQDLGPTSSFATMSR